MKKALLRALLEPTAELRKLEAAGDYTCASGTAGRAGMVAVGRRYWEMYANVQYASR
ncbi:L-rhamnose isomerase [Shigella flexneri]